jgi:hypothetical protein
MESGFDPGEARRSMVRLADKEDRETMILSMDDSERKEGEYPCC